MNLKAPGNEEWPNTHLLATGAPAFGTVGGPINWPGGESARLQWLVNHGASFRIYAGMTPDPNGVTQFTLGDSQEFQAALQLRAAQLASKEPH